MSALDIVAALVSLGITANMTAMAWTMRTLFQIRQEISESNTRQDEQIRGLSWRVHQLDGNGHTA